MCEVNPVTYVYSFDQLEEDTQDKILENLLLQKWIMIDEIKMDYLN